MVAPQQQKLKINGPVAVTANRLNDGVVVWRTATGWSEVMAEAAVATTPDTALALLETAKSDYTRAVEPYVAHVALDGEGRARPSNLRERIRTEGPTVALPGQG